jgi:SAM-dependent methyltransferase
VSTSASTARDSSPSASPRRTDSRGVDAPVRSEAFGEKKTLSLVERYGVWLSCRAVRRHVTFDGKRVADFGCGYEARFARQIMPRAERMLLVDVHLADDLKHHPKVHAKDEPIETVLPQLPSESLDIVMCLSVLEHLKEPQQALDNFRRILVPGGVALINVPSWRGKFWLELAAFRLGLSAAFEIEDHKRYYDPRDLWPMLVRAGFRPREVSCKRHKFGLNTFAVCRAPEVTASSATRSLPAGDQV